MTVSATARSRGGSKSRGGTTTAATTRQHDSFDSQRDMWVTILQHLDQRDEGGDSGPIAANIAAPSTPSSTALRPERRASRRRSLQSKRMARHSRKTSQSEKTTSAAGRAGASTTAAAEVNTKKARIVLDINPVETSSTPTSSRRFQYQHKTYTRPTGPELVSPKHPSCSNLPPRWNYIHDRFIAYLATHAPLDERGKERGRGEWWRTEEIVMLLGERFPELFDDSGGSGSGAGNGSGGGGKRSIGLKRKMRMVENRLALLDEAGDNDYFQMQYGAYIYEEWGRGI